MKQLTGLGSVAIPHLLELLKERALSGSEVRTEMEALGPIVVASLIKALPFLDPNDQHWSVAVLNRFGCRATQPEHLRIQEEIRVLHLIDEMFGDIPQEAWLLDSPLYSPSAKSFIIANNEVLSGSETLSDSASLTLRKLGTAALEPLWNRFIYNAWDEPEARFRRADIMQDNLAGSR